MAFVCVQPMQTSWARRAEHDPTFEKTDEKYAVLIARLTAQLRCYVPEPVDSRSTSPTPTEHPVWPTERVTR